MVRETEGDSFPGRPAQPDPLSDEGLVQAARFEFLHGPLPPPDILAGYENVILGAGERILQMAEREAAHRHSQENMLNRSASTRSLIGVLGAVAVALFGFALAGYAFYLNLPWAGGVLAGIEVATIVGAFIYGTRRNAD